MTETKKVKRVPTAEEMAQYAKNIAACKARKAARKAEIEAHTVPVESVVVSLLLGQKMPVSVIANAVAKAKKMENVIRHYFYRGSGCHKKVIGCLVAGKINGKVVMGSSRCHPYDYPDVNVAFEMAKVNATFFGQKNERTIPATFSDKSVRKFATRCTKYFQVPQISVSHNRKVNGQVKKRMVNAFRPAVEETNKETKTPAKTVCNCSACMVKCGVCSF